MSDKVFIGGTPTPCKHKPEVNLYTGKANDGKLIKGTVGPTKGQGDGPYTKPKKIDGGVKVKCMPTLMRGSTGPTVGNTTKRKK